MRQRIDLFENDQLVREEEKLQMQTELDRCRAEIKDVCRQNRENESAHASEKRLLLQDKERLVNELSEAHATTQRLHEHLRNNGIDRTTVARAGRLSQRKSHMMTDFEQGNAVDPTLYNDSDKKDAMLKECEEQISTLRLENLELHLRATGANQSHDIQLQALERELTDMKMKMARLTEDNESYQVLLHEKTIKGDFSVISQTPQPTSLADELGSFDEADEDEEEEDKTEAFKKLEKRCKKTELELKAVQEREKALTLYVDRILVRILSIDGFENFFVTDAEMGGKPALPAKPAPAAGSDKALPAPPDHDTASQTTTGFLQRAKSVGKSIFYGGNSSICGPFHPTVQSLVQTVTFPKLEEPYITTPYLSYPHNVVYPGRNI
jgi:hypothetical protein